MTDSTEDLQGFATIPRWLQRDRSVTWQMKAVYTTLSSYSDMYGRSFPSHATIAADIPCSVSTVKTALEGLKALGVVTWSRRRGEHGGQTSNVYQISTSMPVDNRPAPPSQVMARGVDNPAPLATRWLPPSQVVATNESQINEDSKSSTESTSRAAVDKSTAATDRSISAPSPARMPSHSQEVDWLRVLEQVSPIYSTFSRDVLAALGREILARAATVVLSPTSYVTHALSNHDQFEWQVRAFDLDLDLTQPERNRF